MTNEKRRSQEPALPGNEENVPQKPAVEPEVIEPLSLDEARRLDNEIREYVESIGLFLDYLGDDIEKARRGQIHLTLGFDSLEAYLNDVFAKGMPKLSVDKRRRIVKFLSSEGMTQTDMAQLLDVSQPTISGDVQALEAADELSNT